MFESAKNLFAIASLAASSFQPPPRVVVRMPFYCNPFMITTKPDSFCANTKTIPAGLCSDIRTVISVTEPRCAAPISKVESHISDIAVHTITERFSCIRYTKNIT